MAVKKSYNRYFIIFQEEDKGYGMAIDKQPTGYTKIENRSGKCKITAYAQNLVKEKGPYYCCLVDSTKDPLVMAKLGAINIDDTGRGETWWEFKEDDIANTGVPFDRFNVAAVITGENQVNAPLAGYIGKDKTSWKDRVPYTARVEEEPINEEEPKVKEEPEELDEEAKKFKEYEENIKTEADNNGERWKKDKDNKENLKTNEDKKENVKGESKSKDDKKENVKDESKSKEDKKDEVKSKGNEDKNENKKENVKSKSEKTEAKKDKDNSKDPEDKDNKKDNPVQKPGKQPGVIEPFNYDDDLDAKEVSGYMEDSFNKNLDRKGDPDKRPFATMFHDILEDFDEEDELTDEFKNTRWWKIPLGEDLPISENMYYPYYCAIYHLKMTYPYINYIKHFKDTGHYHFGMKYDNSGEVKYIIYGIEGNNSSNFQPYMGMTGFIRWIKMKNKDRGMWILYYNPHTGNIMIPKKR